MIREFEGDDRQAALGACDACKGYQYRGPTHVSIGREATSVGCCAAMRYDDQITSTHHHPVTAIHWPKGAPPSAA